MITVSGLVKDFPGIRALKGISFSISKGEVVGFLGPNGAGKTTTLRILTGFLAPSSGRVTILGHDIMNQPLRAKRRIGYLPENVPLYNYMRVQEYLSFRGKLKGVKRQALRERIRQVMAAVAISDMRRAVIGNLSKGYRQRVGLAEAMLAEPEFLILDEPTVGLDPRQVMKIRQLVRRLSQTTTILLSTHILQEVEAVCQRVIIIHEGAIAADEPLAGLLARGKELIVEIAGDATDVHQQMQRRFAERLLRSSRQGKAWQFVLSGEGADPRKAVNELARRCGGYIANLYSRPHLLEEIFISLTMADTARGVSQ